MTWEKHLEPRSYQFKIWLHLVTRMIIVSSFNVSQEKCAPVETDFKIINY